VSSGSYDGLQANWHNVASILNRERIFVLSRGGLDGPSEEPFDPYLGSRSDT